MNLFTNKIILLPLIYLISCSLIFTPVFAKNLDYVIRVRVILLGPGNNPTEYQKSINTQLRTLLLMEPNIELVSDKEIENINQQYNLDSLLRNPSKKIFNEYCSKLEAEHLYYSIVDNVSIDPTKIVLAGQIVRFDKSTLAIFPLKVLSYSSEFYEQLRIAREQLILTILPQSKQKLNSWPIWFFGGIVIFSIAFIIFGATNTSADGKQSPPIDPT